MLVKFQKGEKVVFDVGGHGEFVRLVEEVSKRWGNWLYIGQNAAVRKKDIESIYYLKDGWNGQSGSSSVPQD